MNYTATYLVLGIERYLRVGTVLHNTGSDARFLCSSVTSVRWTPTLPVGGAVSRPCTSGNGALYKHRNWPLSNCAPCRGRLALLPSAFRRANSRNQPDVKIDLTVQHRPTARLGGPPSFSSSAASWVGWAGWRRRCESRCTAIIRVFRGFITGDWRAPVKLVARATSDVAERRRLDRAKFHSAASPKFRLRSAQSNIQKHL